jgi:hypothetical protein
MGSDWATLPVRNSLMVLRKVTRALFRCKKNLDFTTAVLLFVCGKYYLIVS